MKHWTASTGTLSRLLTNVTIFQLAMGPWVTLWWNESQATAATSAARGSRVSDSCVHDPATLILSPTWQRVTAGSTVTFSLTVQNDNSTGTSGGPCPSIPYNISVRASGGLQPAPATWSKTIPTGGGTAALSFQVPLPSSLVPGSYSITVNAIDNAMAQATAQATLDVVSGGGTGGSCQRSKPAVLVLPVAPVNGVGSAGSTLDYDVAVSNRNSTGCGSSTFALSFTPPSGTTGWTVRSDSPSTSSIAASQSSTVRIHVTSSSGTPPGQRSFGITATDSGSASNSALGTGTYTVVATPTSAELQGTVTLDGSRGIAGKKFTLAVSRFPDGSPVVQQSFDVATASDSAPYLIRSLPIPTGIPAQYYVEASSSGYPSSGKALVSFSLPAPGTTYVGSKDFKLQLGNAATCQVDAIDLSDSPSAQAAASRVAAAASPKTVAELVDAIRTLPRYNFNVLSPTPVAGYVNTTVTVPMPYASANGPVSVQYKYDAKGELSRVDAGNLKFNIAKIPDTWGDEVDPETPELEAPAEVDRAVLELFLGIELPGPVTPALEKARAIGLEALSSQSETNSSTARDPRGQVITVDHRCKFPKGGFPPLVDAAGCGKLLDAMLKTTGKILDEVKRFRPLADAKGGKVYFNQREWKVCITAPDGHRKEMSERGNRLDKLLRMLEDCCKPPILPKKQFEFASGWARAFRNNFQPVRPALPGGIPELAPSELVDARLQAMRDQLIFPGGTPPFPLKVIDPNVVMQGLTVIVIGGALFLVGAAGVTYGPYALSALGLEGATGPACLRPALAAMGATTCFKAGPPKRK